MNTSARQVLDSHISEKDFMQSVIDLLRLHGYLVYHAFDSRRSEPGWPDIAAVHPETGTVALWECKVGNGRLTGAQIRWLEAWMAVFDGLRRNAWIGAIRPRDWDRIEAFVRGGTT